MRLSLMATSYSLRSNRTRPDAWPACGSAARQVGRSLSTFFSQSSGIEPEIARSAEATEIVPGLTLPIATTGHLIALKLLARDDQSRPQDLADLRALRAVASPDDLAAADRAARLISSRGFNRGRDLTDALKKSGNPLTGRPTTDRPGLILADQTLSQSPANV